MKNYLPTPEEIVASLQRQVAELDEQIRGYKTLVRRRESLRIALAAIESTIDLPKESATPPDLRIEASSRLRDLQAASIMPNMTPASLPEAAYLVLRDSGTALHVKELIPRIQALGVHADRDFEAVRMSLVSTLDRKAKESDTFTKPEPATYGLLAWGNGRAHGGHAE